MNELEALIILNSLSQVGAAKKRLLIEHYGSALAALKAPLADLAVFPGFSSKVLAAWEKDIEQEQWKRDLILAESLHAQLIPYTSPHYPKRLLEIADYPLILYLQGTLRKEDERCLAVVGTRQASLYGQEMARSLSRELAQAGFTIISGLARGIDTAAHQGALEGGRTAAVLGSGLACLYPRENLRLADAIKQNGAIISEFSMAAPPNRWNFPQRNRLVSGMAMGVLLIEAPQKSGAMLTVERALCQRRPVFALSGRIDQESFKGNHALIKEHQAELVENVADILKHFDYPLPLVSKSPNSPSIPLDKEEEELLQRLPSQELSIEELMSWTKWPVVKLNVLLMSLVLKKMVKEFPGKIYKKI